ncbi:MAG: glycosyltransferase family 39 protein [Candidatus Daviesbacteria bacterium]|nr:glycosyltransferase family 39 protein [Candidatus Daviesbacteria bacterium]
MKKEIKILLFLIILLATFLRVYRLDQVPPSLNWDEVDAGYNAYTIANWGRDEWGKFLPLVFTSFRDDKRPIHIYLTAPVVKLFGLSDFTTRLPGATVGVLSVIVIFYLALILFKSDLIALLSALFLAISPYHLQFSRGLWEINFALFFFMLGLLLFYLALQKKGWFISLSFFSFGLSILSYHSSIIVVPPVVFVLVVLYIKKLLKLSFNFYLGLSLMIILAIFIIYDPRILGMARVQQTQFGKDIIEKTQIFQRTKNHMLGLGEITLNQYFSHFTPQYLFISGDQNPRNSVKTQGEFYKIDALFIFVGLVCLLLLRSKISAVVFTWLLLSPIPSSLVSHAPNATRALFMMGSLNLIAAFGAGNIINRFKGSSKVAILVAILILLGIQFYSYSDYYYNSYPKKDAIEWQYGMKQSAEFVKSHPEYTQVYVTDIRSQPYIFYLFYLKTPLPEYLNAVVYNRLEESKSYNTVSYFENFYLTEEGQRKRINFYFGGWDSVESVPDRNVLYVLSPSQYDGLRRRSSFDVKKIIYYPDGGVAFYLVSGI